MIVDRTMSRSEIEDEAKELRASLGKTSRQVRIDFAVELGVAIEQTARLRTVAVLQRKIDEAVRATQDLQSELRNLKNFELPLAVGNLKSAREVLASLVISVPIRPGIVRLCWRDGAVIGSDELPIVQAALDAQSEG